MRRRSTKGRVASAALVLVALLSPLALKNPSSASAAPGDKPAGSTSATTTSLAASLAAETPASSASASGIIADPGAPMKAYESALGSAKLGGSAAPFSPDEVRELVEQAQQAAVAGRLADVIALLTGVVESPRFTNVAREPEGRAAWLTLGDALAQSGVHALARVYLRKAAAGPVKEATSRAATRRLTEIALDDEAYDAGIADLTPIIAAAPNANELRGELDYLVGRKEENAGNIDDAMAAYGRIVPLSRFWSAATYRRGVLEVNRDHYPAAEALFCQVADPKRQDSSAPVFADERFFAVRDLARLALGRLAHEGKRHDDARYYYYLVPQDSKRLAEGLYESATTRYEAADYGGARDLLDELATLGEGHVYDDESRVLDVYVDIASCSFDSADKKLTKFLGAYTPLRDRVHALATGPDLGIRAFLDREGKTEKDPKAPTAAEVDARVWRRIEADPALLFILRARRRLATQLAGLTTANNQLEGLSAALGAGGEKSAKPAIDMSALSGTKEDKGADLRAAIDGTRKEIAALEKAGAKEDEIAPLRTELDKLTEKAAALDKEPASTSEEGTVTGSGLPGLVNADKAKAKSLRAKGETLLAELDAAATILARDALVRLDRRASRLVARARLAKIDVVLGHKKGLELEVDAIRSGILPKGAIDSIDAARYLNDNEEYWPFEGDEWLDEVIGGEVGER